MNQHADNGKRDEIGSVTPSNPGHATSSQSINNKE